MNKLAFRSFKILHLFLLLGLVISCSSETDLKEKDPPKAKLKKMVSAFPEEEIFTNYINEIDSSTAFTSGPTLHYMSNDETHTSALVFFDAQKSIKKVVVQDVRKNGSSEMCSYYFRGGGLFCWIAEETKTTGESFQFSITKTFLDSSEQEVYSCAKVHSEFDSLEFMPFQQVEKIRKDKNRVIQLVNQEGPFQTLFRGFSDFNGLTFMVVGTEEFTSTLEIDKKAKGDLAQLLKNPAAHMGKKLSVSFTTYTKDDNIEYQKLLNVKFISK
jgi:hypothetical protein